MVPNLLRQVHVLIMLQRVHFTAIVILLSCLLPVCRNVFLFVFLNVFFLLSYIAAREVIIQTFDFEVEIIILVVQCLKISPPNIQKLPILSQLLLPPSCFQTSLLVGSAENLTFNHLTPNISMYTYISIHIYYVQIMYILYVFFCFRV